MISKDICIIGGGGHSKSIISIIKKINYFNIVGYTDLVDKGNILGVSYIGNDDVIFQQKIPFAAIGISYLKTPKDISLRLGIIEKYSKLGLVFPKIISPSAIINEEVYIDDGTVVMDGVVINSGTKIGKFCILNTKCTIEHGCEIKNNVSISPGAILCGDVHIGNNSFIGAGSIIRDGINICSNVTLGAGSNVTKKIEIPGIYFGNPAKVISRKD